MEISENSFSKLNCKQKISFESLDDKSKDDNYGPFMQS